jgi:hypothetical protein
VVKHVAVEQSQIRKQVHPPFQNKKHDGGEHNLILRRRFSPLSNKLIKIARFLRHLQEPERSVDPNISKSIQKCKENVQNLPAKKDVD